MPANAPAPADGGAHEKVGALHDLVLRSLDDDQAQDVVTIPLMGKSNLADHMVIASGRSTRPPPQAFVPPIRTGTNRKPIRSTPEPCATA